VLSSYSENARGEKIYGRCDGYKCRCMLHVQGESKTLMRQNIVNVLCRTTCDLGGKPSRKSDWRSRGICSTRVPNPSADHTNSVVSTTVNPVWPPSTPTFAGPCVAGLDRVSNEPSPLYSVPPPLYYCRHILLFALALDTMHRYRSPSV
jgi:hypothetical protein